MVILIDIKKGFICFERLKTYVYKMKFFNIKNMIYMFVFCFVICFSY